MELEPREEEATPEACLSVLDTGDMWELNDRLLRRYEPVLTEVTNVDTTVEVNLIVVVSSRDEEKLPKAPIDNNVSRQSL